MERNQIIGLALIMMMLVGYQILAPQTEPPKTNPATQTKSSATAAVAPAPRQLDSVAAKAIYGDFASAAIGTAKDIVVETDDVRLTFSTKGGNVKEVLLKKFKTYTNAPLYLIDEQSSKFNLELPTNKGTINLADLYFTTEASNQVITTGKSTKLAFRLPLGANQYIEQTYTIQGSGYLIDYDVQLVGLDGLVKNEPTRLVWQDKLKQLENDMAENRKVVTTNYYSDGELSDIGRGQSDNVEEKIEQPVSWFAHKNKYFLSAFITKGSSLSNATLKSLVNQSDSTYIKTMQSEGSLSTADLKAGKGNFQFFFGPNDYQIVKNIGTATDFGDNVDLGYAFLKPLNKFFFVPMFSFLEKFFSNYGVLIVVLVLIVKLLMTPLVYKSYVSMAKMRMLAPELAIIKEKVGDDAAKMQQEQMKLYQQVGVSPLSGCIPVLATMPILMSLFFLFPNLIELRQQSFLWASDLSTYDAPIKLPFAIPFYGAHVSIFTLAMTVSQLVYAWYNNQITPAQVQQPGMPDMRMLTYFMPVMFMFVMNSFPAGLSFYYLVSNVVTILQQQVIRRFVNDDKIRSILEENRRKIASGEKKKSKFSDMLERSMKAADEAKKQADEAKKQVEAKRAQAKKK
ncbi:YidC/Oxa1 family membrane protein insertase [Runella defluvii]|uniref:Membrane protein insertase YidC n=1 Tax=Runella defluvii TaxID=370973 RepID=A0A7W6ETJ7_9BACT|nr:membrane protein insertase YidC [Runella defluvii]MBB3841667.1 YidC/Oxa1 family membrane protein insertase [Runella defluvii]